jgi:hypothetical protein
VRDFGNDAIFLCLKERSPFPASYFKTLQCLCCYFRLFDFATPKEIVMFSRVYLFVLDFIQIRRFNKKITFCAVIAVIKNLA